MANRCSICIKIESDSIFRNLLQSDMPVIDIVEKFGVKKSAVYKHRKDCVDPHVERKVVDILQKKIITESTAPRPSKKYLKLSNMASELLQNGYEMAIGAKKSFDQAIKDGDKSIVDLADEMQIRGMVAKITAIGLKNVSDIGQLVKAGDLIGMETELKENEGKVLEMIP